jgi:hypothetical protein
VPEPLQPVFLKATAKFKAFALLESGYTQSNSTILCPLCGLKYILLLDKASATQALGPMLLCTMRHSGISGTGSLRRALDRS